MTHPNNSQNNHLYGSNLVWNSHTPPFTPQLIIQQQQQQELQQQQQQQQEQQQQSVHANNNNDMEAMSSQSTLLISSGTSSSTSTQSTSPQVKTEDELFDQIEDMICDYMRQPSRHYLHCRVLHCYLDDNSSSQFNAIIIINPPSMTRN